MKKTGLKKIKRTSRHKRIRAVVSGTPKRPRASVFKSNKNVFIQLVDDISGKTILSNKIKEETGVKSKKTNKIERAQQIGQVIAEEAKKMGITEVVFDRGGFKYHGRVKAVAEGLRKGGLNF